MSSLISILSSDHGRLRREQRDISKRDLLKRCDMEAENGLRQHGKLSTMVSFLLSTNPLPRKLLPFLRHLH